MRVPVTTPQKTFGRPVLGASDMSALIAPYKVSVRLGGDEFKAAGPEQIVKDQLATFLDIARASQHNSPPLNGNGNGHANGTRSSNGNGHANGHPMPPQGSTSVSHDGIKKLF